MLEKIHTNESIRRFCKESYVTLPFLQADRAIVCSIIRAIVDRFIGVRFGIYDPVHTYTEKEYEDFGITYLYDQIKKTNPVIVSGNFKVLMENNCAHIIGWGCKIPKQEGLKVFNIYGSKCSFDLDEQTVSNHSVHGGTWDIKQQCYVKDGYLYGIDPSKKIDYSAKIDEYIEDSQGIMCPVTVKQKSGHTYTYKHPQMLPLPKVELLVLECDIADTEFKFLRLEFGE